MMMAVTSQADLTVDAKPRPVPLEVKLPGIELYSGWSFYPKGVIAKFDTDVDEYGLDVLTLITSHKRKGSRRAHRYVLDFAKLNPTIDMSSFTSVTHQRIGKSKWRIWQISGNVIPEAGSVSLLIAGVGGILGLRRLLMM
jgi:hypothetical protein